MNRSIVKGLILASALFLFSACAHKTAPATEASTAGAAKNGDASRTAGSSAAGNKASGSESGIAEGTLDSKGRVREAAGKDGGSKGATVSVNGEERSVVFFDFDSAELKPEARTMLSDLASQLKKEGRYKLTIEGHCDARGTESYNMALGHKRADAVRSYLVNLGARRAHLKAVSFGKTMANLNARSDDEFQQDRNARMVQ